MKRSEAIEIIKNIIITERSPMIGAEKILNALEKIGIVLPPEVQVPQDEDDIRRNGVAYGGHYTRNEWESENEDA